jgi:L-2-amino-thiazoline-4-carboxylic acid hydrolase
MDKKQPLFSETSHAVLFALIARQVFTRYGEPEALSALRKAIRLYGEQRGRRMALRARSNGDELTMTNYLVYGEWRAVTDGSQMEWLEDQTGLRLTVQRCPWEAAWREVGLLPYGRYYCQEIDAALLRGFNPDLRIEINQTLSNDGLPCEFIYRQAVLEPGRALVHIREKSALLESQRLMPWEYHCGHLYQACSLVMGHEFGPGGRVTVQNALAEFALRYGGSAAATVAGYLKTDFDQLPGSPGRI